MGQAVESVETVEEEGVAMFWKPFGSSVEIHLAVVWKRLGKGLGRAPLAIGALVVGLIFQMPVKGLFRLSHGLFHLRHGLFHLRHGLFHHANGLRCCCAELWHETWKNAWGIWG